MIPLDCAGFWFVYKAHPPVHIRICAAGCNVVDGPKDKQNVQSFLAEALNLIFREKIEKEFQTRLNFFHLFCHLVFVQLIILKHFFNVIMGGFKRRDPLIMSD